MWYFRVNNHNDFRFENQRNGFCHKLGKKIKKKGVTK